MTVSLRTLPLVLVAGFYGCGGDSTMSPPPPPPTPKTAVVTMVSGEAQRGPFGQTLPAPLVVMVATPAGAPISGVKVNWGIDAGEGHVSSASSITDQTGKASMTWTLGAFVNQVAQAWTDIEGSQTIIFTATGLRTLVLHYDGTNWSRSLLTDNIGVSANTGWAASPTLAFAAGGHCLNPFVLTYTNGVWTGMETCNGSSLVMTSMWGTAPNDVWAVGTGHGARISDPNFAWVFHFDGSSWGYSYTDGDASHPPELVAVGTRSTDDVIAVGKHGRIVRHAGSQWADQTSGTGSDLFGVWGDPNSPGVFAVGDAGTVIYHDGTSWRAQTSGTTAQLRSVWGSSATNVFAVGAHGTILHYDGSSWTSQSSGTTQDLLSIWGSSPNSIFAVGSGNTVLRYDGVSWTPQSTGIPMNFTGVWGTSPSDVFVAGHE
jgi:hypothetical protein